MRYVFRVNVHGHGYSLYTCEPGGTPRPQPLDVTSAEVPASFISAQHRIGDLLDYDPSRPYFLAADTGEPGYSALALYGCRFPVPDQYDRVGLTLVCGFLGQRGEIVDLVDRVVRLVEPDQMMQVGQAVAQIASGHASPGTLVAIFDSILAPVPFPLFPPVGGILHDTGGSALAWLGMTLAHRRTASAWAVFDVVGSDGRVITMSPAPQSGPHILLSDYLRLAAQAADAATPTTPTPAAGPIAEPITGPIAEPVTGPIAEPVTGPITVPVTGPVADTFSAIGTAFRDRWRSRRSVLVVGAAALVAAASTALVLLPGGGGGAAQPTDPGPRQESAPPARVIAQYEYRFTVPDGWSQTLGDGLPRRTEIKPNGGALAPNRVVVDEQILAADSDGDPAGARAALRAEVAALGVAVTGYQPAAQFAGREVVSYHQIPDATGAVTDWFVLFHGTARVRIGCQYTAAGRTTVLRACDLVVNSLTITG